MSIARQLYQLQEVDLELEAAEQSLARTMARIGESPEVVKARAELVRETATLEDLQRQLHDTEWTVDDYCNKITALDDKLYGGRINNPKELTSLQQESEILKGHRRQAEDKALELMESIAGAEEKIASLRKDLEKLEASWRAEQAELEAEATRGRAQVAELTEKRKSTAAGIDRDAVASYDIIRQQKGRAVARVEQGACRSCGITLSTAQRQQVRGDEIMRCPNCGRILFNA